MANSVRTPEDNERARVEGRRQQIELIESALASGLLSPEQADPGNGQGRREPLESSYGRLSIAAFARLGIHGLSEPKYVSR